MQFGVRNLPGFLRERQVWCAAQAVSICGSRDVFAALSESLLGKVVHVLVSLTSCSLALVWHLIVRQTATYYGFVMASVPSDVPNQHELCGLRTRSTYWNIYM